MSSCRRCSCSAAFSYPKEPLNNSHVERVDEKFGECLSLQMPDDGGRSSHYEPRRPAQQAPHSRVNPKGRGLPGRWPCRSEIGFALLRAIIPGKRPVAPAWDLFRGSLNMPAPLTLYDNYARALRPFVPLNPSGDVGMY